MKAPRSKHAVVGKCTAAGFAALAAADGGGLGALASDCAAVGVTSDSVSAYATCLARGAICGAADAVAIAAPHRAATFALGEISSGLGFCGVP